MYISYNFYYINLVNQKLHLALLTALKIYFYRFILRVFLLY